MQCGPFQSLPACDVDGYYCPGGNVNATQYRMFTFDDDAALMDDELTVRAHVRVFHSLHRWLLLPGWVHLWHRKPYVMPVSVVHCTAHARRLLITFSDVTFFRVHGDRLLLSHRLGVQHAVPYVAQSPPSILDPLGSRPPLSP